MNTITPLILINNLSEDPENLQTRRRDSIGEVTPWDYRHNHLSLRNPNHSNALVEIRK